jgi:hypothetical protein
MRELIVVLDVGYECTEEGRKTLRRPYIVSSSTRSNIRQHLWMTQAGPICFHIDNEKMAVSQLNLRPPIPGSHNFPVSVTSVHFCPPQ